MSAQPKTLTKCSRDGCENMTANTFCGRECNRLAHCGPGTRAHRVQTTCGIPVIGVRANNGEAGHTLDRHIVKIDEYGNGPGSAGITLEAHAAAVEDAPLHVTRKEWLAVRGYFKDSEASKNSSGARRIANIRKRRQERDALAQRRRDAAKRRRSR